VLEVVPRHAEAQGIVTLARRRAARAARESGARRQLTVMFCDLVGSTEYATALDAEEIRDVLGDFQKLAAETMERYDGDGIDRFR
jgi:class 3 adenylate cyclase